jgi:5'-deoxynucleotidase
MRRNGFFAMVARMKHITRWGLMRNSMRETLAEHSFETAVIAHALAVIGVTRYQRTVEPGKVATAALYHDANETLTGDLPTPVKYYSPAIRDAYKAVEQEATARLISTLPEDLQGTYRALMECEQRDPMTYAYIKAADKISAWIKCVEEGKSGNLEFRNAEAQLSATIRAIDLPEVKDYMRDFASSYGYTLDELQL